MPYNYYLKQCGHQELGSVGADGHSHRGRYLLISKPPCVLSFFPLLSPTQRNDFAPVACIPLYLPEKPKVYCNFVYHNDMYHGSTAAHPRNEYRLYLSRDLEGNQCHIEEGDIVIFRKKAEEDINSPLFLTLVKPSDTANYSRCSSIITQSPLRGKNAVFSGELDFFEALVPAEEVSRVVVDSMVMETLRNVGNVVPPQLESLFNQTMFRDFLLVGYQGLCAVTRQVIRHGEMMNIEAAHIRPRAHHGSFLPSNGLMLSRDLHWAFDKGFFTLNDRYEVLVHPEANSTFLDQFNGRPIFIPNDSFFRPSRYSIIWHRQHLYGQFRGITGVVRDERH